MLSVWSRYSSVSYFVTTVWNLKNILEHVSQFIRICSVERLLTFCRRVPNSDGMLMSAAPFSITYYVQEPVWPIVAYSVPPVTAHPTLIILSHETIASSSTNNFFHWPFHELRHTFCVAETTPLLYFHKFLPILLLHINLPLLCRSL